MISANERDDRKRLRLPKAQFEAAKRETEELALSQYPELKQTQVITASLEEKIERREQRDSQKVAEMKKRGGKLSKREALAQEIRAVMAYAKSQAELERLLESKGFAFYTRGKHYGVKPLEASEGSKKPRAHRFATLGIADDYAAFLERVEPVLEEDRREGEKEKQKGAERKKPEREKAPEREAETRTVRESDNESYVKKGGNADPNREPISKQDPQAEQLQSDVQKAWKREMDARRAEQRDHGKDDPEQGR